MADKDPIYGHVTVTWFGPGAWNVEPPTGLLNRDVQTMTWKLVDASDPLFRFKPRFPAQEVIKFREPGAGSGLSRWHPPGTVPAGDAATYSADANDRVPHGSPAKRYEYDIHVEYDAIDERITMRDRLSVAAWIRARQQRGHEKAIQDIDPPIENEPQP